MVNQSSYNTLTANERDTSPVSPTHSELTAKRREYVAQRSEMQTWRVVRDWARMSSGEREAGFLVHGRWVDTSLADDLWLREISPLVARDDDGNISLTDKAAELLELDQLDERKITMRRKLTEDSLTDAEFEEKIQALYANDPYMKRLHDVARLTDEALGQLSSDGPGLVPVRTFDLEDPYDKEAYDDIVNRIELNGVAFGMYGTTMYVQRHEHNNDDEHLYLHTESAQRLLAAFDTNGLPLHESARCELVEENDKRYGNAYAWMSREIIKMAADREEEFFDEPALEAWQRAGQLIPETGDDAADTMIALVNQFITRGDDRSSDFPVPPEGAVKLREDSCKDVEEYFDLAIDEGELSLITTQSKDGVDLRFIEKTHGAHTMLAVDPVKYCGIVFPPGTLWAQRGSNEGFVPLRLTGFCFDAQTAAVVFGDDNLYQHRSSEESISVHRYLEMMSDGSAEKKPPVIPKNWVRFV